MASVDYTSHASRKNKKAGKSSKAKRPNPAAMRDMASYVKKMRRGKGKKQVTVDGLP